MVLVDETNHIAWSNEWAEWLFRIKLGNNDLRQLSSGEIIMDYTNMVRKYSAPPVLNVSINGIHTDIEGRMMEDNLVILRFHTRYMSRASMLELRKLMQDVALETGDRVNNPLTTVLNCLHMLQRDLGQNNDKAQTYIELAIREANVIQGFGEWVRRLSEEPPCREEFDLIEVIQETLDRRGCLDALELVGEIPLVKGCAEHAALVLGGLTNLIRQASSDKDFTVTLSSPEKHMVTVFIDSQHSRVKDLRMLTEEFYGGLGLLAARYLLALMQAQLDLEFLGDVGIRVTFLTANAVVEDI